MCKRTAVIALAQWCVYACIRSGARKGCGGLRYLVINPSPHARQVDQLHFYQTMEEAVVASVGAGVDGLFTGDPSRGVAALTAALNDGNVDERMLDKMVSRLMLNRFRLGEFDSENPSFPFRGPFNE